MANRLGVLCLLVLLLPAVPGLAAPTQDEVDAAKRTQAVAEAEKAIAEASKAKAEAEAGEARAKLGTLELSKLSPPTAEAKTLNVEANLLAYASVQALAKQIAGAVQPRLGDKAVVIFTEKELKALDQVQSFSSNLAALDTDIVSLAIPRLAADNLKCAASDDEAGGGLGVLGSLDVVAQVLSLFKVNKKLEGTDVTVDGFALSAAVLAQLKQKGASKAIYPPLFFSGAVLGTAAAKSQVEQHLDSVSLHSPKIDQVLTEVARRREALKARVKADKKPTADCRAAYAAAAVTLDSVETRAKILKGRIEKYVAAATTPDEKTGETLLQALVAAEALRKSATGGFVLQLKPIAAGGATLTKTTFFTSSFRFSGGAVAAYMLVSGADGTVVDANIVGEYGGYVAPDDLSKVLEQTRARVAAIPPN